MAPLKIGLIGYGFSTKCFHLPFIVANPALKVHAFLQRAPAPTEADKASAAPGSHCTVDYPDARHYQTAAAFFADEETELVVVCSHADTHAAFAVEAMEAGKDVVVEKPFTRTTAEADHVIAVSKKTGRLLTVFQNRRYDSDFRTIRSVITSSALGSLTSFENHYDLEFPSWMRGPSWERKSYTPGEGMLFGLGTHTLDQVLVLFGRPVSVTAFLRALRGVESEIEDSFLVVLRFGGELKDLLVEVSTTVVSPMREQVRAVVRGREGSFVKYGTCPQEVAIMSGGSATDPDFGHEDPSIYGLLATNKLVDAGYQTYDAKSKKYVGRVPSQVGDYGLFYRNVLEARAGREALEVRPETARDGLRIIELARESHERGVTVGWRD